MPRTAHGHSNRKNRRPARAERDILRLKRERLALAEAELRLAEKLESRQRDRERESRIAAQREKYYG